MNITENAPIVYAYIDPGTGSMLFTILVGAIGVLFYGLKGLLIKLKYFFSSDKSKKEENNIPLVIFSDDKRYWTTFKPICDELEKRRQNTVYMTFSEDDPALKSDYEYVKAEHIKGFARLNALKADIVLSTTPSGSGQKTLSGMYMYCTWQMMQHRTGCSVLTIMMPLFFRENFRENS